MAKKKNQTLKFNGRIVHSDFDFQTHKTDIIGKHQILFPKTKTDVVNAVKLLQNTNTIIKSGNQTSNNNAIDGNYSVVLNLTEIDNVTVKDNKIKIDCGTNIKTITESLIANELAIPISDNQNRSIVSNLKMAFYKCDFNSS